MYETSGFGRLDWKCTMKPEDAFCWSIFSPDIFQKFAEVFLAKSKFLKTDRLSAWVVVPMPNDPSNSASWLEVFYSSPVRCCLAFLCLRARKDRWLFYEGCLVYWCTNQVVKNAKILLMHTSTCQCFQEYAFILLFLKQIKTTT